MLDYGNVHSRENATLASAGESIWFLADGIALSHEGCTSVLSKVEFILNF
jgi:hypothetical protein